MNIENLIATSNAILENAQTAARGSLHDLWEQIRERKDLPVMPAAWLEAGANGTGYFDHLCEMGSTIPMGVLFKGNDRHGRMVVVCRSVNNGEVMVMFDRYSPGASKVICHQIRGGGANVDCNGHQSVCMLVMLAENVAACKWHNEKYEYERAVA